ncbi:copper chaperone PCu(A)C [Bartonella harrusi]|uniref:Copper chaperone PCu(A)C n=1 Tax=Bartonella harrusi TaxID=2961895 RepID=A0ABY5EVR0_9HYPH|nr:copper chaperone PCu(A)C [Bartonella harrusi]UTO28458.1 copper chaperone PCu(A)C [Bartonella harrusi]
MIIFIVKRIKDLISKNLVLAQCRIKNIIKNVVWACFFTFVTLPATAQQYQIGNIEILHPWTRATPKGIKVSSGYLYIINHSNTPDRLVSVSTNGVQTTEIHSMAFVNDIMKMEKMHNGVEIPGDGEVSLKPGGDHIMFMGLSQPFKPDDKISAKLTFEKAGTIDIEFSVHAIHDKSPAKKHPTR